MQVTEFPLMQFKIASVSVYVGIGLDPDINEGWCITCEGVFWVFLSMAVTG